MSPSGDRLGDMPAWQQLYEDCTARDLAAFETLVLSQQPASTPWRPVTDYSFEARKAIEGRHPELIWQHLIDRDAAKVLDYGCGPDAHLVRLLQEYRWEHLSWTEVKIAGYEPQRRDNHPAPRAIWDLVICREVFEHCTIREIRRLVSVLCTLSAHLIYVTTRFAKAPTSLLSVDTSDELDPSHISMLNQNFLRVLFVLEGFKRRADLETKMDWQQKGRCLVYERV